MRFPFLLFLFSWSMLSVSQVTDDNTKSILQLEPGGIDNQGNMAKNQFRVRTKLISKKGCIRLYDGYNIMNCAQYDLNGDFMGFTEPYYSNGYYYWNTPYQVKLSLYHRDDFDKNISVSDNIVKEYYSDAEKIEEIISPIGVPPYYDIGWRNIIQSPYDKAILRLPIISVFNNGDIFISCEMQDTTGKHLGRLQAVSINAGREFVVTKCPVPLQEIVYDKCHDVLYSISLHAVYRSKDHGKTWAKAADLNLGTPKGFNSLTLSPTTGIQLSNGILAVPLRAIKWGNIINGKRSISNEVNLIVFSRDYGKTWEQSPITPSNILCDESIIIEGNNNHIVLNARGGTEWFWDKKSAGRRILLPEIKHPNSRKKWRIEKWKIDSISDGKTWDCLCHASITFSNKNNTYYFCNPYMPGEFTPRRNLHLSVSRDARNWRPVCLITPYGKSVHGYSGLCAYNNYIYMVCEADYGLDFASVTISSLNKYISF